MRVHISDGPDGMDTLLTSHQLKKTPIFQCVSRCVYRSFSGDDEYFQRCLWLQSLLKHLTDAFCIQVLTYNVRPNNYDLLLFVDEDQPDCDIIARWHVLFEGTEYSRRRLAGERLYLQETDALSASIDLWRKRLADVSWFMRALNNAIAKHAEVQGDIDIVSPVCSIRTAFDNVK